MTSDVAVQSPVRVAEWNEPEGIAARGTLVVIGGRGETPEVYERFGTRISRDAYRVRAIGDATADTDAVRAVVEGLLADESLPSPKVLVGSDAGAALALEIAASAKVDAVVLAGIPTAAAGAAGGAGSARDTSAGGAGVDDASVDGAGAAAAAAGDAGAAAELEITARTACPNHQGVLRREHVGGALSRTLPAELLGVVASGVGVPLLAIHGADDTISPVAEALAVYSAAPRAELHTVAGGRHDILNDVTHRSVAATVVLFLERVKASADAAPIVAPAGPVVPAGPVAPVVPRAVAAETVA